MIRIHSFDGTHSVRTCSVIAGALAIAGGLSVLVGWIVGIAPLKSVIPGVVAMNPVTAIAFVLAGVALLILQAQTTYPRASICAQGCALAVAAIGLMRLAAYATGWDGGLDRLLFADALGTNRMAPNTAASLFLLGLSLLLLNARTRGGQWAGQLLAGAVAVGSFLALVGYLFNAEPLYGVATYTPMALNTAAFLGTLAVGTLCARPSWSIMAVLTRQGAGGLMVRRLLPIAIGVPVLLGGLRLHGERVGLYGREFGVSLMVVLTVVLFLASISWTGRALNRVDDARDRAQQELSRAHAELEQRVQERTAELAATNESLQAEIVERIRAAAAERASEDRFRLLIDSVKDYAILMLDPAGQIVSWNSGAERIQGYCTAEIVGQHFSRFYRREDVDAGKPDLELRVATNEGRFEDEGWRVRKDGSLFWANVVVTAVRDASGRLQGFSKVTRDITERRRTAEHVQALNAELQARVNELATINSELAHKNQENEVFVYSVSHDLRSPLVNLQGFSKELSTVGDELREILDATELPSASRRRGLALIDDEMRVAIRFIQSAVTRLGTIIDALLRLSRAGRLEYQRQQVALDEIIARIVQAMAGTISDCGAEVTVHDLPPTWGDAPALEQVFANLIGNALNYLDPTRPGCIEVGASAGVSSEDCVTYYVKDNGLGIPEAYQSKVFQTFQRLHPERAKGEGMGLAIVRRIVERHGGKVWVESTDGVGSTFYVMLKCRPPADGLLAQSGSRFPSKESIPCLTNQ